MAEGALSLGTIVAGRYTVHALLGRRRGRATYHAICAPNRHVALKVLDPALAGSDAERALAQAAAVAAELPEGAVLHVLDRGVNPESGAPFLVTPFSDHPSLEAFVSLCPLSLQEMVTMARSLARGLDAAHRRGLAHLALRPSNVFVGPPPVCWTRVGDFGSGAIDRAIGAGAERDTLAFAAPELYAGAPASLTTESAARADVFSAALLCFFAAAGDTYWKATRRKGGSAMGPSVEPLAIETRGLRAPASVAAREIGVAWDPRLDAAFARALSSEPSARFGSVGELAEALAQALDLPGRVGANALADSLVMGDPAPPTMRFDEDDEPPTRMAPAAGSSVAPASAGGSVAPPPDSIAPTGPSAHPAAGGLGGTMLLDPPPRPAARGGGTMIMEPPPAAPPRPPGRGGTMIMESSPPDTSPSPALISAVPPPAALPAFGVGEGGYPLPPPGPHPTGTHALVDLHATPPAVAATAARAAPGRGPWIAASIAAAMLLIGVGGYLGLRAMEDRGQLAEIGAGSGRPATSAAPVATPPSTSGAPKVSTAPVASAAPEVPPPVATGETDARQPIPTTYGQQPKPQVVPLDPPNTWYAELVITCEPACDLVLVQGGPEPNPSIPKQLPPGTYTVTVRQSGGIQSQAAVLRAATRTTLKFDGRLVLPEPAWRAPVTNP